MDEEIRTNARRTRRGITRTLCPRTGARRLRRGTLLVLVNIFGLLFIPTPASAQFRLDVPTTRRFPASAPTTIPAADLAGAVKDLRNPDSALRERARAKLLGMSRPDLETLQTIVAAAAPLNKSQSSYLREIVNHVFLATEPYIANNRMGFLGVKDLATVRVKLPDEKPDPDPDAQAKKLADNLEQLIAPDEEITSPDTGVIISERMPGFCGYRFLDPGDVILAVRESQFAQNDLIVRTRTVRDLQTAIRAHEPGDSITLQVLRRSKPIDITFVLDAFPQAALEGLAIEDFRRDRETAADDYWKEHFVPIIGQPVS